MTAMPAPARWSGLIVSLHWAAAATIVALVALGWRSVILGLAKRVEAALQSNLPPADLKKLSPAVRRRLAELRAAQGNEPFD